MSGQPDPSGTRLFNRGPVLKSSTLCNVHFSHHMHQYAAVIVLYAPPAHETFSRIIFLADHFERCIRQQCVVVISPIVVSTRGRDCYTCLVLCATMLCDRHEWVVCGIECARLATGVN